MDDDSIGPLVLHRLEQDGNVVLQQLLGLAPNAWGPIHYFKYRNLDDLVHAGSPCGDRPCTLLFDSGRVEIHSPAPVDQHELAHGFVLRNACGSQLFREGLAVSISCSPVPESAEPFGVDATHPSWLDGSWRDLTSFDGENPTSYVPAGALVTWLVDNWGMPRFLDFYRALSCTTNQDDSARIFEGQYGRSLDSVWSDFVSAPRRRLCLDTFGCSEGAAAGDVALSNGASDYRIAVPISAQGAMIQATYAPDALTPVIRPCSNDGALPAFHGYWPPEPAAWLPIFMLPGSAENVVALRDYSVDPTTSLALTVTPFEPASGASNCADIPSISIASTQGTGLIWPRAEPLLMHLQSSVADASQTVRLRQDAESTALIEACSDCIDGVFENCGDPTFNTLNAPWLRIGWSPALFEPLTLDIEWL